jgi:hypothetical protein
MIDDISMIVRSRIHLMLADSAGIRDYCVCRLLERITINITTKKKYIDPLDFQDSRPAEYSSKMAVMMNTYEDLWKNLWGKGENLNIHRRELPVNGVRDPTLTYEAYDLSSLPRAVLPGLISKFMVRQEYLTLYGHILELQDQRSGDMQMRGVVVIGHPGIGL